MWRLQLRKMGGGILLAALFPLSLAGQQNKDTGCVRRPIPLTLHETWKLSVLNSWLSFEKALSGEVTLRNDGTKAIEAITLVANYLDQNDNPMFTITYQAKVKGFSTYAHSSIQPFFETRLDSPVEPKGIIHMSAGNFLSTTEIPAKALASVLNIWFADGTVRNSGVSNPPWRSEPMLVRADAPINLALDVKTEPVYFTAELKIDEYGNVSAVELIGMSSLTIAAQSLSRQLGTWHFFPAIEDGYARAATLAMVLDFQPVDAVPAHHCFLAHPGAYPKMFAFLTLEREQDQSESWKAYYNGYPVDAHFPRSVVLTSSPARTP